MTISVLDILDALVDWKFYGDATSLMLILASLLNWLPALATILSIIWVGLRIYELDTVQRMIYRIKKEDDE